MLMLMESVTTVLCGHPTGEHGLKDSNAADLLPSVTICFSIPLVSDLQIIASSSISRAVCCTTNATLGSRCLTQTQQTTAEVDWLCVDVLHRHESPRNGSLSRSKSLALRLRLWGANRIVAASGNALKLLFHVSHSKSLALRLRLWGPSRIVAASGHVSK